MTRALERTWVQICLFAAICVAISIAFADDYYYMNIAVLTLLVAGLCVSWNLAGGFAGLFSFAHTIFIALGAILPAFLAIQHGVNPWLSMLVAVLVSALAGAGFGWMRVHFDLKVLTFALVTLGFSELTLILVTGTRSLGGGSGLSIPASLSIGGFSFDTPYRSYFLTTAWLLIALIVSATVLSSKLGFFLIAIRDNSTAARGVGIPVLKHSMYAMAISAGSTALFGALYAQYFLYVDPYRVASPIFVIEIVLFTTLGGLGTLWGPVVGAVVFVPLAEILRAQTGASSPGLAELLTGVVVILVVSFGRRGLVGFAASAVAWSSAAWTRRGRTPQTFSLDLNVDKE